MNNDYCNWLDAGRAVTIFGIPVLVYLVFIIVGILAKYADVPLLCRIIGVLQTTGFL